MGTHFCLMVGCSMSFLPKTMRWLHHFRHSSTTVRDMRITPQHIMKRSWLKLLTNRLVSIHRSSLLQGSQTY